VHAEAQTEVELERAILDQEILVAVGTEDHGWIAVGDGLEDGGFERRGFQQRRHRTAEVRQKAILLFLE
jgi:hypothetical protein